MLRLAFYSLLASFLIAVAGAGAVIWYIEPTLPSIDALKDVRLQVPLRIYSRDGALLGEFGEVRRTPVRLDQIPRQLINAVLATEDQRFYQHIGVDPHAVVRAVLSLIRTRKRSQGASTITMQLAREYFLSREKTYSRKLNEMLLALKIERELDKDQILELYLNTIFLGQRAYGVAAAAQVYYGVPLAELTVPQLAMLAGLPQAPSRLNPISNRKAALERRSYVLRRMFREGHLTLEEFTAAMESPETARLRAVPVDLEAPYVAEAVRSEVVARYGEDAYAAGLRVYTTVESRLQRTANDALRAGLIDYDRRHGWRGAERHVQLPAGAGEDAWRAALDGVPDIARMEPAVVVAIDDAQAVVYAEGRGRIALPMARLAWARRHVSADARGPAPRKPADVVAVGDIVRIERAPLEATPPAAGAREPFGPARHVWRLAQVPAVSGALVSVSAEDGAILATTGGFDFALSKFNRVLQARRQPGSNFKPFVYSAALDAGYTTASFINDAPIVFDAPGLESAWRPENYSGRYYGPTRLREALAQSRNLVSIRLLRALGVERGVEHAARFGFDADRLPHNLSLALGSGEVTPLEIVRGYAAFANGGFLVEPYLVDRIENERGEVLFRAEPVRACAACEAATTGVEPETIEELREQTAAVSAARVAPRAVSAENAWLMTSMLRDVIRSGTGRRALSLGRDDLAGKTGTTNDQRDAWFSGYNGRVVTTAWAGFDQVQTLGRDETGARTALPIWIDFMRAALDGTPSALPEQPPGLVTVRIDPDTGMLAGPGDPDAIFETFRTDSVPGGGGAVGRPADAPGAGVPEQLF